MKLLTGRVTNFASYTDLKFNFADHGLTLIYGPTGAGKSTLCDIAVWILYGITAKDGNVDEVRSWRASKEVTSGYIEVCGLQGTAEGTTLSITRTRGPEGAGQNDLYFQENNGPDIRGKDIKDTQRLLDKYLGVDGALFIAGSYFHEFSPSGAFFVATAKDRRALFEKIAPLALPAKLADKSASCKKELKGELARIKIQLAGAESSLSQILQFLDSCSIELVAWKKNQEKLIRELNGKLNKFDSNKKQQLAELINKSEQFEQNKAERINVVKIAIEELKNRTAPIQELVRLKIENKDRLAKLLVHKCPTCGGHMENELTNKYREEINTIDCTLVECRHNVDTLEKMDKELKRIESEENIAESSAKILVESDNPYIDQCDAACKEINPHMASIDSLEAKRNAALDKFQGLKDLLNDRSHKFESMERIYDLSFELRGLLLSRAIKKAEESTNAYLESHFDSELKVHFRLEDADNVELDITKNSHPCVYKQLSKGQRQLLKLCFAVSVMEGVSDSAGIHFDNIFLDESMDGMDADLKVKAYALLEAVAKNKSSVFVIDHSIELQSMFFRKYHVTLDSDYSILELECG